MEVLKHLFKPRRLLVFTDGAIRPPGKPGESEKSEGAATGLAAIVRDESGVIQHWWARQAGPMTCHEAEYAAVILALESLRAVRPDEIAVFSDSKVMVDQMQGTAKVRAGNLRAPNIHLRSLAGEYDRVTFHHIPRERNRLADALANEALEGRVVAPST